jgi:hypothetical protein
MAMMGDYTEAWVCGDVELRETGSRERSPFVKVQFLVGCFSSASRQLSRAAGDGTPEGFRWEP